MGHELPEYVVNFDSLNGVLLGTDTFRVGGST